MRHSMVALDRGVGILRSMGAHTCHHEITYLVIPKDAGIVMRKAGTIVAALLLLPLAAKADKTAEAEKEAEEAPGILSRPKNQPWSPSSPRPRRSFPAASTAMAWSAARHHRPGGFRILHRPGGGGKARQAGRTRPLALHRRRGRDLARAAGSGRKQGAPPMRPFGAGPRKTEAAFGLRSPWRDAATGQAVMRHGWLRRRGAGG